jgi:tripartite-type tricarboxylate transporter receptor subunit TctC
MHRIVLAVAVLLLAAIAPAYAQLPAGKSVRLVVPFPAGGATDLLARAIAQRVATQTGQNIVVDNGAGAGGSIGSAEAAKAAPDGATLLMAPSSAPSRSRTAAPSSSPRWSGPTAHAGRP